jgi:hypothetical protein
MNTPTTQPEIRKRAWKKILYGIGGCILFGALFAGISAFGYMPGNPFMLIPAAMPFVYFCIGFIELITGRPYQQLADAWMSLKGWQRGVIGTFIVMVGGVIIIFVVAAAMMGFK